MTEWSQPGFSAMASIVERETGLSWSAGRRDSAEAAMQRAMKEARVASLPAYVQLIREDAVARDELIAELTIGETYFFRDADQFTLIRDRLLPDLARRSAGRPLRVWSAGCASGEEAYSLAIVLAELGLQADGCVVGSDIARHRLAAARRARFTRWSLRGVAPSVVARYFRHEGRDFELDEGVRQGAEFRYLNLAEDRYPSLASGIWAMDLILCRNVLIYFDRDTVARVAQRLMASLSEDGWLVLGASDPPIADLVECEVHVTAAGIVYRRAAARGVVPGAALHGEPGADDAEVVDAATVDAGADDDAAVDAEVVDVAAAADDAAVAAAPPAAAAADTRDAVPPDEHAALAQAAAAYAASDYEGVVAAAAAAAAEAPERMSVLHVRALANLGRVAEASRVCMAALDRHRTSAELTYLHAVLLGQAEHAREAAAAARQALYLDRTLVVAHIALADASSRLGDGAAARRSLRNAGRLLDALDAGAAVPAADGETVGRLAELVRTRLRLLEAA